MARMICKHCRKELHYSERWGLWMHEQPGGYGSLGCNPSDANTKAAEPIPAPQPVPSRDHNTEVH